MNGLKEFSDNSQTVDKPTHRKKPLTVSAYAYRSLTACGKLFPQAVLFFCENLCYNMSCMIFYGKVWFIYV